MNFTLLENENKIPVFQMDFAKFLYCKIPGESLTASYMQCNQDRSTTHIKSQFSSELNECKF